MILAALGIVAGVAADVVAGVMVYRRIRLARHRRCLQRIDRLERELGMRRSRTSQAEKWAANMRRSVGR